MDGGKANLNGGKNLKNTERGQNLRRAVGMAGKMAGRQKPAEQALQGKHSRRTLRPAQASKRTDGPQLAGLAAKTTAADDVGLLPCR